MRFSPNGKSGYNSNGYFFQPQSRLSGRRSWPCLDEQCVERATERVVAQC